MVKALTAALQLVDLDHPQARKKERSADCSAGWHTGLAGGQAQQLFGFRHAKMPEPASCAACSPLQAIKAIHSILRPLEILTRSWPKRSSQAAAGVTGAGAATGAAGGAAEAAGEGGAAGAEGELADGGAGAGGAPGAMPAGEAPEAGRQVGGHWGGVGRVCGRNGARQCAQLDAGGDPACGRALHFHTGCCSHLALPALPAHPRPCRLCARLRQLSRIWIATEPVQSAAQVRRQAQPPRCCSTAWQHASAPFCLPAMPAVLPWLLYPLPCASPRLQPSPQPAAPSQPSAVPPCCS